MTSSARLGVGRRSHGTHGVTWLEAVGPERGRSLAVTSHHVGYGGNSGDDVSERNNLPRERSITHRHKSPRQHWQHLLIITD